MAAPVLRELKIGTIVDKTFQVIDRSTAPALIYLAVLTVVQSATKWLSLDMAPMQQLQITPVNFVVGVVGAYLLLDAMLGKTGLRMREQGQVFLPYVGLSILYTLGVLLGLILVIIGALFVMARWSIAQPLLVARGEGVMQALGESWERTKGNEFQILVAWLAMLILPIAVVIACSALFDKADVFGIVVSQLATSAISVISLASGVALYGLILGGRSAADPPVDGSRIDA